MKVTTFLSVNNGNLGAIARIVYNRILLPLNKGFKNMFELLQSCAQPSKFALIGCFVYERRKSVAIASKRWKLNIYVAKKVRDICMYGEIKGN